MVIQMNVLCINDFCRVTKTGVNYYDNVRDYQLGSSYYRYNGYDEFVCNGCIKFI